jgi:hypothetical protein
MLGRLQGELVLWSAIEAEAALELIDPDGELLHAPRELALGRAVEDLKLDAVRIVQEQRVVPGV